MRITITNNSSPAIRCVYTRIGPGRNRVMTNDGHRNGIQTLVHQLVVGNLQTVAISPARELLRCSLQEVSILYRGPLRGLRRCR